MNSPRTLAHRPVVVLLALACLLAASALFCSIPGSQTVPETGEADQTKPITPSFTLTLTPAQASTHTPTLPPSPTWTASPTPDTRVGLVSRELDVVQRGKDPGSLQQVTGSSDLFAGDVLSILEGGEGLLDFGSGLRLRVFNNTQLGILAASAPGTPLDVRLFLEDGGFTGQVTEPGGQVIFNTPNNAQITVLGTTFLVAYNSQTGITTVANFEGQVEVSSLAGQMDLPNAHFTLVHPHPDRLPDPPRPFSIDVGFYEQLARRLGSPLLALWEMGIADFPPRLRLQHLSTDFIDLGSECTGTDRSASFWVEASDDWEPENMVLEAFWVLNGQRGEIELVRDQFAATTYIGEVGGFNQPGQLLIHVFARDSSGQTSELEPIEVEIGFCIG
jgi:hypothetical protein